MEEALKSIAAHINKLNEDKRTEDAAKNASLAKQEQLVHLVEMASYQVLNSLRMDAKASTSKSTPAAFTSINGYKIEGAKGAKSQLYPQTVFIFAIDTDDSKNVHVLFNEICTEIIPFPTSTGEVIKAMGRAISAKK